MRNSQHLKYLNGLLSGVFAIFLATGCASSSNWQSNTGVRPSDPQFTGPRNINYDRLIVPGVRIGPVAMGGEVLATIQHLGQPDRVDRSTIPGFQPEVYYNYDDECISFTWIDLGINPKIETGWRGINVTCDKWATLYGARVGMPVQDVVKTFGEWCPRVREDGTLLIATKQGIWFFAQDRNSPVTKISVVPTMTTWNGLCTDQ
jgi:hypothetical protein